MFWFKNWPFFKFRRKLTNWIDKKRYPDRVKMPETIKFSRTIWGTIRDIKKNTGIDGAERGVTVLDIDGLLIITPAILGESERVLLRHQFKVEYQYEPSTQRCYRQIYRDNRLIIKDYFLAKRPPRSINLRILFNMHTHPHGETANFFSGVDIESFLSVPRVPAMILVASDIWLLLKSAKTQTQSSFSPSTNSLKQCQEYGLVIYKGKIGERLKKVG